MTTMYVVSAKDGSGYGYEIEAVYDNEEAALDHKGYVNYVENRHCVVDEMSVRSVAPSPYRGYRARRGARR
jgi:hypothetical protein